MPTYPFQRSLAIAHLLLFVAGVALLAVMAFGLVKIDLRIDKTVDQVDALVKDTQKRLDGTFENTNALIIQAGLTADEVRETATTEQKYLRNLSMQALLAVKAGNLSLRDLDGVIKEVHQIAAGIDTGTLPKVNLAITSLTAAVDVTKSVIAEVGPAIDQLTADARTTDAVLEDLHTILDAPAMREIAPNVAGATKHLDGTAAEFEETVGYIRDDFKPNKKNFWHNLTSQIIPELLRWFIPTPVKISHSPL